MLEGTVTYPGLANITGVRMTLGRGSAPGVGTITMYPQDHPAPREPQTLSFVSSVGTLEFPRCVLDVHHIRPRQTAGGWRWDVTVFDRRYFWWRYHVDGVYNERLPNGKIRESTRKSARELARLILDGIEETTGIVDAVPDNLFPPCRWVGANAAVALQWLCEYVSCVIGFNTNNVVQITPYGVGSDLPTLHRVNPLFRWALGSAPQTLRVFGGPTIYQSKLRISPLMVDSDDETALSPDGVDYQPTLTWGDEPWTNFGNVAAEHSWRAAKEFCRQFQVVLDDTTEIPGSDTEVNHVGQLLPLLPYRIDTFHDESEPPLQWQWPPQISGDFWPQSDLPINVTDQVWSGNFDLECETGLVRTEYPVFTVEDQGETPELKLYLETAHRVRDLNGQYDRIEDSRNVGGLSGEKVIVRPEIFGSYSAETETDTRPEAEAELAAYLDAFAQRYATDGLVCDVANLLGFQPVPIDGRIAQIVLEYGHGKPPMTTASLNYEVDIFNDSFEQSFRRAEVVRLAEAIQ